MLGLFSSLVWRWMIAAFVIASLSIAGGTFTHMDALAGDHGTHTHAHGAAFDAGHSHSDADIDNPDGGAALHCGALILLISGCADVFSPTNTAFHVPVPLWASEPYMTAVEPPPPRLFSNIS